MNRDRVDFRELGLLFELALSSVEGVMFVVLGSPDFELSVEVRAEWGGVYLLQAPSRGAWGFTMSVTVGL